MKLDFEIPPEASYRNKKVSRYIEIFVDGVQQDNVVFYSIPKGIVQRLKKDANGEFQLNLNKDGILKELVRGKVEVRIRLPT